MSFQESILYYADHPVEFITDHIDFTGLKIDGLTEQQIKVVNSLPQAIRERKAVSIRSGHGIGKSGLLSLIILWFISTRPNPKIPCTAPTQHQLNDILWSELSKWHSRFKLKDMFTWTKTKFFATNKPETWYAIARTGKTPEAMQGFHAEHLLFIVDEASGVNKDVMEVIEGALTEEGALCILTGNPTQITGTFFDSFHTQRKFYINYVFSSEDSPLVSKEYCTKIGDKYGYDSDIYRVRVKGEFPKAEPDTLISLDRVEKAAGSDIEPPPKHTYEIVEIGVDVARYGSDESTIYKRIGDVITMEKILQTNNLTELSGMVMQIIRENKTKMCLVNIDETGMGAGVVDMVDEQVTMEGLRAQVFGVNNGGKAQSDTFTNVSTEMWDYCREWLLKGRIPNDNDLIAQLSCRKFTVLRNGKMVIETKEQMRARKLPSPDRADGLILCLRSLIYSINDFGAVSHAC